MNKTPPAIDSFIGRPSVRLFGDSFTQIVWAAGRDGATHYLNESGRRYAGLSAAEGNPPDWVALIHPVDVENARLTWRHAIETARAAGLECRLRRFDGVYRWHDVRISPMPDPAGEPREWVGTATDIDDARTVLARLRTGERSAAESLALLETLQANAPIGFGFVDRQFRRVRVNERLAEFNGMTVAEQIGKHVGELVPLLWPQMEPLYRRVLETGQAVLDVEVSGPSQADPESTRHWSNSYYPVSLHDEVIGIGVVAVEITEQRRAEQFHRQMAAIVEGSGEAIFGANVDGIVTAWNPAAERLFGYAAGEMVGRPISVLSPGIHLAEQQAMRDRLLAGGATERHDTLRARKDGTVVDVHLTASPVHDQIGAVVGFSVIVEDITARVELQRVLTASQRRLAEAQRISEIGSFELDLRTDELAWSEEHFRILGLDPDGLASLAVLQAMVHPDDQPAVAQAWAEAAHDGRPIDMLYRLNPADGRRRWVHTRAVPDIDADGKVVKLAGTLTDDTDRVETAGARRAAVSRFEAAFEQGGIGAGILGLNGIPIRVNAAVCTLMGRPPEALIGRSWADFSHPDDTPLSTAVESRIATGHDTYADERRYLRPDGSIVWTSVHITLVRDENGAPEYFLAQLQDIRERKQMEADLTHNVLYDSLTGLANRALLIDRITNGLTATRRHGTHLGVILLDIDHFKVVNDTHGHRTGDEVLNQAAARISRAIRASDSAARVSGDEFVIVCEGAATDEVEYVAERVRMAVNQPFQLGSNELHVTASIGIAVAGDEVTPEGLLADAGASMYLAKRNGRDRIHVSDPASRSLTEQRLATASDLRHALSRNEFTVFYQPVIDIATGRMVSTEALLRWGHPDRGFISPTEFIPLAEESGLIIPIGAWVLEQACAQLVEWRRVDPAMSIAVNLSVRQIRADNIIDVIAKILDRTGVTPAHLCLELTESVFMEDAEYFGRTLARIKELGVTLSIDDFGTGFSSLSYLKRFPVDAVKIDRAFVDGLGADPHASALVAAILAMADALQVSVIAEGVETSEQLEILRSLGCRKVQGFYLARPASAARISEFLAESRRWH